MINFNIDFTLLIHVTGLGKVLFSWRRFRAAVRVTVFGQQWLITVGN